LEHDIDRPVDEIEVAFAESHPPESSKGSFYMVAYKVVLVTARPPQKHSTLERIDQLSRHNEIARKYAAALCHSFFFYLIENLRAMSKIENNRMHAYDFSRSRAFSLWQAKWNRMRLIVLDTQTGYVIPAVNYDSINGNYPLFYAILFLHIFPHIRRSNPELLCQSRKCVCVCFMIPSCRIKKWKKCGTKVSRALNCHVLQNIFSDINWMTNWFRLEFLSHFNFSRLSRNWMVSLYVIARFENGKSSVLSEIFNRRKLSKGNKRK